MGMVDPLQLFRRYGPLRVNPPNTMQGSAIAKKSHLMRTSEISDHWISIGHVSIEAEYPCLRPSRIQIDASLYHYSSNEYSDIIPTVERKAKDSIE
jgi:hypothetical protein